jgi:uncharacterized membrane protein YhaH (DUF805 family)
MGLSHRGSHYWLWFLLFGVIPLVLAMKNGFGANATTYNALWLVGSGLLGLLLGNSRIYDGRLARPFDFIIGIIFTLAGLVGIVKMFGIGVAGADTLLGSVGLTLGTVLPLIYAFLGLKSLHHALTAGK